MNYPALDSYFVPACGEFISYTDSGQTSVIDFDLDALY